MGESPSARTDRELSALRSSIDSDLRLLQDRLREDADPRRLMKRNPIAVFGALGSIAAIGVVTTVRGLAERRRRRSDKDVDALISRLGGRVNQLRGRARDRFRKQLREEIGEIETQPSPVQIATTRNVNATSVPNTKASAIPNHFTATRFAWMISAISCRGSSSCLRM